MYGWDPLPIICFEKGTIVVSSIDHQLVERDQLLEELKIQLLWAQCKIRPIADQYRRSEDFIVGELVYLKMHPYHRKSLARRINEKLAPRYYGPFEVLSKIGKAAYRLNLPPESLIHPIFHVF